MTRDYQRQKVYDWENKIVAPRDRSVVAFENIPAIVSHIWAGEGLLYPPSVVRREHRSRVSKGRSRAAMATGSRTRLTFKGDAPTWLIVHELAHALANDGHGPRYVGTYMKLLDKYLGISLALLMYTAKEAKIDFDILAKPYFID